MAARRAGQKAYVRAIGASRRITVPKAILARLGVGPGDRVAFVDEGAFVRFTRARFAPPEDA